MLSATFRSLRHRPFRQFFIGQTISVVGFWLQQIALSWLVYRLTKSPVMLGVVAFAGTIPMLVLSPLAGVIVDRVDRRLVVLATQSAQMLQAFALAALTFTGSIRAEFVPLLALVYGVAWSFDAPARQALLPLMVGGREDMPNAIALNALIMNLGRFVGPVLAGLLLAFAGEAWCFLLNGLSFLAVLRALYALPSAPPARAPGPWRQQFAGGFAWVWSFLPARLLIGNLVLMSFTVPGYQSLMPIFAAEVFAGDARVQGLLVSSAGVGALASTALLAARPSVRGLVRVVMGAPDHQCALVGSGAVQDFEGHCYIGTSSWIECLVPFKKTDIFHSIASIPSAIPGRYQCINEQDVAGGCLSFFLEKVLFRPSRLGWGTVPVDAFRLADEVAATVPAGSRGVLFTPWLNGERTPVDSTTLRGGFYNLSLATGMEDMLRAIYEGWPITPGGAWAMWKSSPDGRLRR